MWGGRNKRDRVKGGGFSSSSGPKDRSKYTPMDWAYEIIHEIKGSSILPVGHSIYDVFPSISGVTERIIDLEICVCVDYGSYYNSSSVRTAVEIAISNVGCPYRVRYTLEKI